MRCFLWKTRWAQSWDEVICVTGAEKMRQLQRARCVVSFFNWGRMQTISIVSRCREGSRISAIGRRGGMGHMWDVGRDRWKYWASLVAHVVKNLPAMQETRVRPLDWENPREKGMATHSSVLALENSMDRGGYSPWGHKELDVTEWITLTLLGGSDGKESACNAGDLGLVSELKRCPEEGNGYPLQYACLENPMDRGAWWVTVHGVTKSWTRPKLLSIQALLYNHK